MQAKAFFVFFMTFLTGFSGYATVIVAGKSADEDKAREARSHEAALKHACAVGLVVGSLDIGVNFGSGVYLGESADGKRGLILTAAHLFVPDRKDVPSSSSSSSLPASLGMVVAPPVVICFGPRLAVFESSAKETLRVPATRIHIHPKFEYFNGKAGETRTDLDRNVRNDLAILEFDYAAVHERVAKGLLSPAVLYDGTGYQTKPLLEAEIVGFGRFATSTSPTFAPSTGRAHSGNTFVTFASYCGRQAFRHVSPMSQAGLEAVKSGDPDANDLQFNLTTKDIHVEGLRDHQRFTLRSHSNQALGAPGDSGGPLFFNTSSGLKVAGIFSKNEIGEPMLVHGLGKAGRFVLQTWEPVVGQVDWVHAVRQGAETGGKALDLPSVR